LINFSVLLFLAGRFFRKLLQHKPADAISGSNSPIGKNILSAFPSRIAQILGLPNFSTYTGHCWRRTTATIAAGKGMTIPQIKQITGHCSSGLH
jgi:integrase